MLLITCSISNKHPCYFQNKHIHFQTSYKLENIFKKINNFVYILTNENHYKVCLYNGLFKKYFQKPHKAQFQTKASDLESNQEPMENHG